MKLNIERLLKLPAMRKQLAEAEADSLRDRQKLIDAWHAARTTDAEELAALLRQEQALSARIAELRAETHKANNEAAQVRHSINLALGKRHQQAAKLEQQILADADFTLLEFLTWASRAANLAKAASHFTLPRAITGVADSAMAAKENAAQRAARETIKLCNAAIERAEALRRSAVSSTDLHAELDKLAGEIREALEPIAASAPGRLPTHYASEALPAG